MSSAGTRSPRSGADEPSAVARAVRDAARFDRTALSLRAGVIAAIPVVGVLAAGTLAGNTVAAVTAGAGAMLVGVAWRVGGGHAPVATMAIDTAAMGLSTFAGSASGNVAWLHLPLLVLWSFAGGLLVAGGRRSATVGTQAMIAFVVFGRFSEPIPQAAGLAGLILAGGAAQVLCSALFGTPPALRLQRTAVAEAYRRLALVAGDPDLATGMAAAALDEAERELVSPTLLGDAATLPLSALVQEGRRMRLEFAALALLLDQFARQHGADSDLPHVVGCVRERAADALRCVAAVVEAKAPADRLRSTLQALDSAAEEVAAQAHLQAPNQAGGDGLGPHLARHVAALAGQIRAAGGLAAAVHEGRGRIAVRPSLGSGRPWERLAGDVAQIRANVSLQSPAGRHALRLAVIVPATWVLSEHIPLARGYWIPVAAATVLRPDFAATFTRGVERMAGTCAGVVLAGLVAVALHPTGWVTVALVGLLAWAAYSVFPASFAAGIAFLNAMIVFLLEAVAPSTLSTATDRGIDTLVGGTIGLLAYLLWPTWASTSARQALVDLFAAQRDYVHAVLTAAVEGRPAPEEELRPLARRARLAWTKAEATVENSRSEPPARRIDEALVGAAMTSLRRLVQAAHVLRLELQERPERPPMPALRPLADAIDETLTAVAQTLATGVRATELPPLRALHHDLATSAAGAELDPVWLTELDEIVDAADTVAAQLGSRPVRG